MAFDPTDPPELSDSDYPNPDEAQSYIPVVEHQRPVKSSEAVIGSLGDDSGTKVLAAFISVHPFTAFFCWLAHNERTENLPPTIRVAQHRKNHGWLYGLCVTLDLLIMFVAVVAILAVAALLVTKLVWPPPWMQH